MKLPSCHDFTPFWPEYLVDELKAHQQKTQLVLKCQRKKRNFYWSNNSPQLQRK